MLSRVLFISVALLLISNDIRCSKILAIFPFPARSHYILGNSLMRALAEKGHDVTMISPFRETNPPKNGSYNNIVLEGIVEKYENAAKEMNFFEMRKKSILDVLPFMINFLLNINEDALRHPNVQNLLNSNQEFDVVIVEQFMNEAHKAFATHFKAPLIVLSSLGANPMINGLVANPSPLSYVPDMMMGFPIKMTFSQRCINTLMYSLLEAIHHIFNYPMQDRLIKKYFDSNLDLEEVMYNVSLILLNSHPSTNQPVPYVPNMIDIGGYHVKPPKKLPQDLQEFLDDADEGVIYFSLGSNMKSAFLPLEIRQIFLNTFSKLKVKVLWKWEEDVLPGQPKNVRVGKWLPQQDILAHPNIKLFITHGGLLSTTETVYHGVPVLALPLAADQTINAKMMGNQGFGLWLDVEDLTEETLTESINEILGNKKYSENAKKRSQIFHDRLVNPVDTATYWVEYVIRHKGAPHLRVAGVDLPWYQYFLLDVIGALVFATLLGLFVTYKITKKVIYACCKRKTRKLKRN